MLNRVMGLPKLCYFTCFWRKSFIFIHIIFSIFHFVAEFGLTKQPINVQFEMVRKICCNFYVTNCDVLVSL